MIISDNIIPDISVNDPSVMLNIPASVTAATGIDALTHAVEAYVAAGAHTLTDFSAFEAVRLIKLALARAVNDGQDKEAREMMAQAQFIAGLAFNSSGLGMVHAMAHPAGAHKDLPHGVCNAILLPIICEFNREARQDKFAKLALALGVDTSDMDIETASKAAVAAIRDLNKEVNIPSGFAEFGVTEADFEIWADDALADPCAGAAPVAMTREDVIRLYKQAL